ncbi:hypothetical protein DTO164E3_6988 [Paecilomyces variotii]|nr:hypothetical protein DTO164E3_6988 [Paecilomyces variotii]KAJ9195669.1 hypothetical protein DTO032I3_6723 [Paecilomyces variotii]KAJ9281576.1 hypothetical protein DTO021D3_1799 [Paecilomyces variotii]KAJ9338485.1 hypothetical protein DTO027B6_8949 [Paecilomyces variotii]KAJ9351222.1 hypothetical protein DTO027B9_6455 [Paecilomyces variotii]
MRSFTFISLLCTLLVLATFSAAWPWPQGDTLRHGLLVGKRAATSTTEAAKTDAAKTEASKTEASKTETAKKTDAAVTSAPTATGTNTAKETGTHTGKASGTSKTGTAKGTKTSSSTSSISINPAAGPGGISMLTPSANAQSTYYKIGDYVTFKWNYTSLSITPSAVNVVASCSLNSETYTLSHNMSVHPTGAVTWDTGKYQATATVPLLTASYTLIVYDVDSNPSAVASAGHLSSQNQYTFGMYLPQSYTPLNAYECVTCNGAMSELERHALGFMFTMATITFVSFTWFAGGFGVFST